MLLVPEDIIQVDAFIPQTWLYEPSINPFTSYIDLGNSRKTPLDASLNTGSAIFVQNSPQGYKVGQTLSVCAFPGYDPSGSIEAATKNTKVEQTTEYNAAVLVNGVIPAGATPNAVKTAIPTIDTVTVTHPSLGVVVATIEMTVSNPIANLASIGPIHYQTKVTVDRSNPTAPTYTVAGTNQDFPAYEIYINSQQVYRYSPIPGGYGPTSLAYPPPFNQTYNNTGPLQ